MEPITPNFDGLNLGENRTSGRRRKLGKKDNCAFLSVFTPIISLSLFICGCYLVFSFFVNCNFLAKSYLGIIFSYLFLPRVTIKAFAPRSNG